MASRTGNRGGSPAKREKTAPAAPTSQMDAPACQYAGRKMLGVKGAFRSFQDVLRVMGNDSLTYAHALSIMALQWADMEKLQADVEAEGVTVESTMAHGESIIRPNPKVIQLREVQRELRQWFMEFGLTPASIHRVSQKKAEKANTFGDFLEA